MAEVQIIRYQKRKRNICSFCVKIIEPSKTQIRISYHVDDLPLKLIRLYGCGAHVPPSLLQCCNLLLVEALKDPLCFKVSDQTIPKQQHIVQVSVRVSSPSDPTVPDGPQQFPTSESTSSSGSRPGRWGRVRVCSSVVELSKTKTPQLINLQQF